MKAINKIIGIGLFDLLVGFLGAHVGIHVNDTPLFIISTIVMLIGGAVITVTIWKEVKLI